MDTYRGKFGDSTGQCNDWPDGEFNAEADDDHDLREAPPSPVGQDERRMQVRAYNHWASLLNGRSFPAIEDLDHDDLPDFGPYSVLLDFTAGIDNPSIPFLGAKLADECGAKGEIGALADVPARSLLSRITDHYMQIIANQAPIGFEAEFVNQREHTILYRGILLPFSSDDDTIDFIYGVINWKELADQQTTDALLQEVDQALDRELPAHSPRHQPLTDWADGPSDAPGLARLRAPPRRASRAATRSDDSDDDSAFDLQGFASDSSGALGDDILDLTHAIDPLASGDDPDPATMALADYLASARQLAEAAHGSEDRTRHALYAAIGRAYDFALAAEQAPQDFADLVADSGLTIQHRAPMTPVVKLVFGAAYDKTRLTEYASALSHARRIGLGRGELRPFLSQAAGGLKGIVAEERRLKRIENGKAETGRDTSREALARKLRNLGYAALDSLPADGSEFTLLVARRLATGEVVLLGEVADDIALLEKAARKLE